MNSPQALQQPSARMLRLGSRACAMRAGALPGPASLARRPPGDGAGVLDHRGERCGGLRCHAGSSSALRRPAARPASWLASAAGWRDGSPGWRLLGPQCGIPMLGGGLQPEDPGAAGLQLALQQWKRPAAAPRAQPGSSKRAQPPLPAPGCSRGRAMLWLSMPAHSALGGQLDARLLLQRHIAARLSPSSTDSHALCACRFSTLPQ